MCRDNLANLVLLLGVPKMFLGFPLTCSILTHAYLLVCFFDRNRAHSLISLHLWFDSPDLGVCVEPEVAKYSVGDHLCL